MFRTSSRKDVLRLDIKKNIIYGRKTHKLDCFKIKNFCSIKDPFEWTQRQGIDWDKICLNYVPEKDYY